MKKHRKSTFADYVRKQKIAHATKEANEKAPHSDIVEKVFRSSKSSAIDVIKLNDRSAFLIDVAREILEEALNTNCVVENQPNLLIEQNRQVNAALAALRPK